MFNKIYSIRYDAAKVVIAAVFVFFIFGNSANSIVNDSVKCIYLDALYSSLPEMEDGRRSLDKLSKDMQNSLKKKYNEGTRLMQELQKSGHNISDDEKQKRLTEIQNIEKDLRESQMELQREFTNKRAEIKLLLIKIVKPAIDSYCRSIRVKVMMGLERTMPGEFPSVKCVYVDPTYDATNQVLSILKNLRAQKSKTERNGRRVKKGKR